MSLAYRFFVAGILFGLTGMTLGAYMGLVQDFTFAPVHAHINLIGWVTLFICGLYYCAQPSAAEGSLPEAHFWCAVLGAVLLPIGIFGAVTGRHAVDLAVIPGTILTILGMALLLVVVAKNWWRQRQTSDRTTSIARRYPA